MLRGFEAGRISAARLLSSQIRNVTIAAESLAGFVFEPGADVTIRLPRHEGDADERHYSVWKSSAEGKFDLCVTLHGLGPGSRWAARCAVGNPVEISRSNALPIALDRSTEAHLFFGDETSDRLGRGDDPSLAGGGCRARVLRSRLDGPPLAGARDYPPRKGSLGGSRRTTWLGACLLARAPKPPVCGLRNRLRDR
jgi:hypothetical protein